jgi:hypothetical protein
MPCFIKHKPNLFKKNTFYYNPSLWCFWKENYLLLCFSFSLIYDDCCMLSGVRFFLFVCVLFSGWSSSWESRYFSWMNLKFSISKASGLLPLHILFEPNQHMITKFTFMTCINWWVTNLNTPNLSNLIHWSTMGIVLYFSSYAIAITLTLCSHSCL